MFGEIFEIHISYLSKQNSHDVHLLQWRHLNHQHLLHFLVTIELSPSFNAQDSERLECTYAKYSVKIKNPHYFFRKKTKYKNLNCSRSSYSCRVDSSFQSRFFCTVHWSDWTQHRNPPKNPFLIFCWSPKSFNLFFFPKTRLNVLLARIIRFVLDGDLTLYSGKVLEINTTVPSVNCGTPSCNYNASHENRSSSGYTFPVAVITFTGGIVFKSGSIVKVFGEYALSLISLNGSIDIQTDINMTCRKTVLETTCLGGFTQPATGESVGPKGKETLVHRGKKGVLAFSLFQVVCNRAVFIWVSKSNWFWVYYATWLA